LMGRPRPLAKEGGFARPARPKMVISAKPTRIARHSAGGGRLAKMEEPEGDDRVAIVAAAIGRLVLWLWMRDGRRWMPRFLRDTYHYCRSTKGKGRVFVYVYTRDV
jgi:hypothetical protein